MSERRRQIDGLVDDVVLLGRRGLPREQYFAEVAARLRRVIDSDATCWHTLDPQTGLMTSDAPAELISSGLLDAETAPKAGERIVASEYFIADVNTFAGLASRRVSVGILSRVTGGRPERSTRYRELLEPAGIPFELRAAFVTRGRCWGAVHIARREHKRDFTDREADVLARLTGAIADGIRTSVRFDAARQARAQDRSAPGLVVLGPANEVELITTPAQELLEAMRSSAVTTDRTPTALLALAAFARRHHAAGADGEPDIVAVPTRSGWITLHASLPDGRADGRVAIVLERTATPQATALRLEADGVTPREREIATLIAHGRTNPEIAEALFLSPYTVQDHIKSLFEKTGVASRQELVARVFLDDYLPHLVQRAPLTSAGAFAQA
jgi:DNA-binding CsgD family transcriptional regulator